MPNTYYDILNLHPTATSEQIKEAYRHLVHLYHPDISTDPNASAKILQINTAYTVLKNPIKRAEYDLINGLNQPKKPPPKQSNDTGNNISPKPKTAKQPQHSIVDNSPLFGSASFSFDAVFSAFEQAKQNDQTPSGYGSYEDVTQFGQHYNPKDPTKGTNKHLTINIDLAMAYQGGLLTLKTNVPTRQKNGSLLEDNKTLTVKIPKGTTEGHNICLKNMGNASPVGGENGDLLLTVTITTPSNIHINGSNVYQTLNITPWEALFGTTIKVDFVAKSDKLIVNIPPNSHPNQTICHEGKGIPAKNIGNLYFVINITNPDVSQMSDNQLNAYQQLQKTCQTLQINR